MFSFVECYFEWKSLILNTTVITKPHSRGFSLHAWLTLVCSSCSPASVSLQTSRRQNNCNCQECHWLLLLTTRCRPSERVTPGHTALHQTYINSHVINTVWLSVERSEGDLLDWPAASGCQAVTALGHIDSGINNSFAQRYELLVTNVWS